MGNLCSEMGGGMLQLDKPFGGQAPWGLCEPRDCQGWV